MHTDLLVMENRLFHFEEILGRHIPQIYARTVFDTAFNFSLLGFFPKNTLHRVFILENET